MATLTADAVPYRRETVDGEVIARLKVADAGAVVRGQVLQFDDAQPNEVRNVVLNATAGFAGIALEGGAVGEVIDVLQRGRIVTTVNDTVAIGDEGISYYADTANTNNNPADIVPSSVNNLPVGTCGRVITTGAQNTNLVAVDIEADGFASR